MKRTVLMLTGLVAVGVVGLVVWWFTSTDIDDPVEVTAPPLQTTEIPETTEDTQTTESTTGAVDTTVPTADSASTTDAVSTEGPVVYELTDGSLVTFELDEVLNGSDKRVVATNPEVAAQLSVDPADLSTLQLGTVLVGAQTFETDSSNRNRAIRGPILDSSTFETIQFVPTSVDGLSGAAAVGDVFEFTITGDLTIRDITNSVTFDVSASLADPSTIEGTAESTVSRADFDLNIPSVPSVADVSDEVLLRIDFVAAATG